MTVRLETTIHRYTGLAGDTMPTGVEPGSYYWAYDTNVVYKTYDGTNWSVYTSSGGGGSGSGMPYLLWASGPPTVEDNTVQAHRLVIDIVGIDGIPLTTALVVGTISISRIRAGVVSLIVNGAACSKSTGQIYYDYTFTKSSWQAADEYRAEFSGQTVTVAGTTYSLPPITLQGVVGLDAELKSSNLAAGAGSNADNTRLGSLVRWITDNLAAGTLPAWVVTGTFTTSSTTVPADNVARTEVDNFWNDSIIIPQTGAAQHQARAISSFAHTGGVFTLDKPFTTAPGTVAYWLIPNAFSSLIGTINSAIANGTYGLSALQVLLAAIPTTPMLAANGALEIDLGNAQSDTIKSINAKIGNIARSLAVELGGRWNTSGDLGTDIAALIGYLYASGDVLKNPNAKFGDLARTLKLLLGTRWDSSGDLGTDIGNIKTKTDKIILPPFLIPHPAVYTASVVIPIIGSAADQALGTLTIAGIPTGATAVHLFVHFLFGERVNSSGATNSLSGAQNLQVKLNAGGYHTFLSYAGGEYSTPATQMGGDARKGTVDLIASIVPVNGDVLTFQWALAGAVGASLTLAECQVVAELYVTL